MRDKEKLKKWRKENEKAYKDLTEEQKERRREAVRRYRQSHKERLREYSRNYETTRRTRNRTLTNKTAAANRLKKKLMVLAHYGSVCRCCGEKDYHFLSIDHIDGGGNAHRKSVGGGGFTLYMWIIRNNFPEGFQVLCFNCNLAKGIYGECPHAR